MKYGSKFKGPCKAGTLCVKLAREVVFGPEVLKQCTVRGCRDLPALPSEELVYLKEEMIIQFSQYWRNPGEFELIWIKCVEAVIAANHLD